MAGDCGFGDPGEEMAAMATVNGVASSVTQSGGVTAGVAPASSLSSSTVRFGALRVSSNAVATTKAAARGAVRVRAAGNPERIDNFVEGAKSDASKNAQNFGDAVAQKAGEVQGTIEDVGRDIGAKAQEAVDTGSRKLDEAGDKAGEVGADVQDSTKQTLDSATNTRNGQSVVVPTSSFLPTVLCNHFSWKNHPKSSKNHQKLHNQNLKASQHSVRCGILQFRKVNLW